MMNYIPFQLLDLFSLILYKVKNKHPVIIYSTLYTNDFEGGGPIIVFKFFAELS